MDRLKERLREQYAPLVERFVKEVGELDLKGIPAPHIPIMGKDLFLPNTGWHLLAWKLMVGRISMCS